MVQLLKPAIVKVVTKNGECEISINLNINITTDGLKIDIKNEEKQEKAEFIIPDFMSHNIKFGKKVE
jgi:hypothetical protein